MSNKVIPETQNQNKLNKQKTCLQKLFNLKQNKKFILGIIDPQNDFCEGGSLAVFDANKIFSHINKLRILCKNNNIRTFISQDYHPPTHMSFASTYQAEVFSTKKLDLVMENNDKITVEQKMWPKHCVQGTFGAEFYKDLIIFNSDIIIQKGTKMNVESYSAFGDEFNNRYENTGLNSILRLKKITDIILVGLATDYCVYNTALDAIKLGYNVHIILSCVRGVDSKTTDASIYDLQSKGALFYEEVQEFINRNISIFENINICI